MEQRVSKLEEWRDGHEQRCEDRQNEIKSLLKWIVGLVVTMGLALLGWSLVEVYHLQTATHPAPAPVQQAPPPTIIYAPPGAAPVVVNPVQGQTPSIVPAPP